MKWTAITFTLTLAASAMALGSSGSHIDATDASPRRAHDLQLGSRPVFLISEMDPGPLRSKLESCASGPFKKTDFSIGHRGAPLHFPEHTQETYEAASGMGAGILECDVTFTKDKELVCRHSQCDLHTTTNILATPLAAKCSQQFTPATYDSRGTVVIPASANCCTSDITLAEFKTLRGKMDTANLAATSVVDYLGATPPPRTDLYPAPGGGTLMSHRESIALFKQLGTRMTPELKAASVSMPFEGFTQQAYAQKLIDEYRMANIPAHDVWPQSLDINDVYYWIANEPEFGVQAVALDAIDPTDTSQANDAPPTLAELQAMYDAGVRVFAPPMWALLTLDDSGKMVPSQYALDAKTAGRKIITWTLERSGILADGDGGWYYQSVNPALNNEGDTMEALHVLASDVGIVGIFSDWPATVTYYANCMDLQ